MNEYTVVDPRGKDTGCMETGIYPFLMFTPIFIPLMPAVYEIVKDFSSYKNFFVFYTVTGVYAESLLSDMIEV